MLGRQQEQKQSEQNDQQYLSVSRRTSLCESGTLTGSCPTVQATVSKVSATAISIRYFRLDIFLLPDVTAGVTGLCFSNSIESG